MNEMKSVVVPFPSDRCRVWPATTCVSSMMRLPSFAARPFSRDGLVYGVGSIDSSDSVVALANVSGLKRIWAASERPWGSRSEGSEWLAGEVVFALRPDWRECFWSVEFLASVARDFRETFLASAPWEGGVIGLSAIRDWMDGLKIGRPSWDYPVGAYAGGTAAVRSGAPRSI